jgi:hypothetical protein
MFKRNKIYNEKRRWKTMVLPKNNENQTRYLRFLESRTAARLFIEKDKNYKFYIVSRGTNPGKLKVVGIATDIKSAIALANIELEKINKGE